MCLIIYSPAGNAIDRSVLAYAYNQNPDGIGVMSKIGPQKFMGQKALKRARRYIENYLVSAKLPFAIHFRWATHGDVILANTHPYVTPDGQHWVMHNGVIHLTTQEATPAESDTAVFVRKYMTDIPSFDDVAYFEGIARKVGWANKLCVMNAQGKFILCNDDAGVWIDGIWYSNTYSLPSTMANDYYSTYWHRPLRSYEYVPEKIWDDELRALVPNPAYKTKETKSTPTYLLPRSRLNDDEQWNKEDRRAYYESLEAGLTVDAEYYDAGIVGEQAARAREASAEKEEQPIGGDFAPDPVDDEEDQSKFRVYLKKVAAGIYSS